MSKFAQSSFGVTVRCTRQKTGQGVRELARLCQMSHVSLLEIEGEKFNPTLETALKIAAAVTDTKADREKLLRIYLRSPHAGILAEHIVAEALRRGGLNVTLQKKNRFCTFPTFDVVVDAGEHLSIGINVKVIKRE